jgi:hypothetical protein
MIHPKGPLCENWQPIKPRGAREILIVVCLALLVCAIGITDPVHTWLHAHLGFMAGVLVGSVLEMLVWFWVAWRNGKLVQR